MTPARVPEEPEPLEALEHESFRAILSAQRREGDWLAAEEIEVRAILGEVVLDFRQAELPASGCVEIEAVSIGGEVRILLPADAEIELDGTPVVGSIEQELPRQSVWKAIGAWVTGDEADAPRARDPERERPYFRIEGRAIFGSIKVVGGG